MREVETLNYIVNHTVSLSFVNNSAHGFDLL